MSIQPPKTYFSEIWISSRLTKAYENVASKTYPIVASNAFVSLQK